MKKVLLLLSFIVIQFVCNAQEFIYLESGDSIKAKIEEIGVSEIKFKLFDNQDGPMRILDKKQVIKIKFADGNVEYFTEESNDIPNICEKAKYDANTFYTGNGPETGTFCCAAGTSPLFGAILAVIINANEPKEDNLHVPDINLYQSNSQYRECYKAEAYKIKQKKTWRGFWEGTAVYAVFMIVYYATQ